MRWTFQEWFLEWTMWSIGWRRSRGFGWNFDEVVVACGPLRLVYLGEAVDA